MTLEKAIALAIAGIRLGSIMMATFGVIAVILAVIGIYSVMSYSVSQRNREIGIRMALGAQVNDVLRLIVGNGALLVGIGLAIGLPLAFGLSMLMASLLGGLVRLDLKTFAMLTIGLTLLALVSSYIPAKGHNGRSVDIVAIRIEFRTKPLGGSCIFID